MRAAEMRLVFFGLMGRPFSSCAENGENPVPKWPENLQKGRSPRFDRAVRPAVHWAAQAGQRKERRQLCSHENNRAKKNLSIIPFFSGHRKERGDTDMKKTIALKENHEFRRLYHRGTSSAGRHLVLYCRKNRLGHNRLGLTVSAKLAWCGQEKPHQASVS